MVTIAFTGRLAREPKLHEVAVTDGGKALVCEVRLVARDTRGRPVFLDCAQWGAGGRAAAEHLTKGSLVSFSGELRYEEFEGDGGRRQHYSAVGRLEFLGAASTRETATERAA
jgi:single-stranded DNA-binding protein